MHKRPARIKLKEEDRLILLRDVQFGKESAQVGFEDAERTYDEMIKELTLFSTTIRDGRLPIGLVEGALWSSNLLDEAGLWAHPNATTQFDEWLGSWMPPSLYFDKFNNLIEVSEGAA